MQAWGCRSNRVVNAFRIRKRSFARVNPTFEEGLPEDSSRKVGTAR